MRTFRKWRERRGAREAAQLRRELESVYIQVTPIGFGAPKNPPIMGPMSLYDVLMMAKYGGYSTGDYVNIEIPGVLLISSAPFDRKPADLRPATRLVAEVNLVDYFGRTINRETVRCEAGLVRSVKSYLGAGMTDMNKPGTLAISIRTERV